MNELEETRDRFVTAIADRVKPDAIAEVHFFQSIKQGLTESAVAVVAAREGQRLPADTAAAADRMTVYTAKYRLTLKGPDRGKWEFALHAEADAPLVTVDKVVQGVQRRSGDAENPEKLSGEEFRALLPPTQESAQSQSA